MASAAGPRLSPGKREDWGACGVFFTPLIPAPPSGPSLRLMKHWRCEDERERLKEAAREMREAGAAMQDVADALEVPAPTLYRWAAEGRWRAMDIAQVRMRAY